MATKHHGYKKLVGVLAASALAGICQPVWSAGFQLQEQNASDLGTAFAGSASRAEDASIGYFNPAGLSRLGDEQIALSGVWITSNGSLTATKAQETYPSLLGTPISVGSGRTSVHENTVVPALHYTKRIDENWVFAFNVASPFGLKNKFQNNSVARYMATRSELRTANVGPSLSYSFNNGLSLGAGVDALYAMAKLDSRIGGIAPSFPDGFIENTASNWGVGYHVGAMYEFTDCTRFGVNYRSKVKVKAEGDSVSQFLTATEERQGVKSTITFPDTAVVSAYHAFNEQFALMADVQWTHWTRFDHLTLRFDDGSQLITPEKFKNSVRVAVGASYQQNDQWKFSIGTAFDKTPTRDATRTVRIPDQNRTWGAVGAQYRITKCLALDVGYSHLFFKKAYINESAPRAINVTQPIQSLQGTTKTRADLIGIQLTWDLV
jgi:long-chain fatty acid transport protein